MTGGAVAVDAAVEREELVRALFAAHYVALCRLAHLLLGDGAAAEEVVQEAFLRTFVGWRRLRRPECGDRYLRAAVVNLCRSRLRRLALERRFAAGARAEPDRWEDRSPQDSDDGLVARAVRALPPRQRAAVVLRYYSDLPEADIAATLGCSVGTVKSQLAKARVSLARTLSPGDLP